MEGVIQTAEAAVSTARNLLELTKKDRLVIQSSGRTANSALRIHQVMQDRPIISLRELSTESGLATTAVSNGIKTLVRFEIAREITGMKRNRLFCYNDYLTLLNEETELYAGQSYSYALYHFRVFS